MSEALKNSTGSIGTLSNITKHNIEIEGFLKGSKGPSLHSNDPDIEDPTVFALESHLEDFLVQNWGSTSLGDKYDIFIEEGELVGQQYPTDTGPLDILAISKNKKEILVVELKKGKASDKVIGQLLRYMGYVQEQLAEEDQVVRGVIIALEDDVKIKRALAMVPDIDFYRYKIKFELIEG